MDALKNADIALQKEVDRSIDIVFRCMALALHKYDGWSNKRIDKLSAEIDGVIKDVSSQDKSVVQICDEETGIEIQCGDGKHWYDLPYLNTVAWENYLKKNNNRVSRGYLIACRNAQVKWTKPQIYASVLIAMHRLCGFGYERLARLSRQMVEIEQEYNSNAKLLDDALETALGIRLIQTRKGVVRFYDVKVGPEDDE